MVGSIDARSQAAPHALAAVRMAGDLQSEPMRFIDDRLNLLQRQRRAVDQRRIRFPHVHRTHEILRGINLDPVDAVQFRFAHSRASEPRGIDVFVFREHIEKTH